MNLFFNKQKIVNSEIVLYFVEWCPYCKEFLPEWIKFENYIKKNMKNVAIYKINCDHYKKIPKGIIRFPTIIFYKDNIELIYDGERKMEYLIEFVKKNIIEL